MKKYHKTFWNKKLIHIPKAVTFCWTFPVQKDKQRESPNLKRELPKSMTGCVIYYLSTITQLPNHSSASKVSIYVGVKQDEIQVASTWTYLRLWQLLLYVYCRWLCYFKGFFWIETKCNCFPKLHRHWRQYESVNIYILLDGIIVGGFLKNLRI